MPYRPPLGSGLLNHPGKAQYPPFQLLSSFSCEACITLLLKAETIYSATHINITGVFTAIAGLFTSTPVTLLTLTIQR